MTRGANTKTSDAGPESREGREGLEGTERARREGLRWRRAVERRVSIGVGNRNAGESLAEAPGRSGRRRTRRDGGRGAVSPGAVAARRRRDAARLQRRSPPDTATRSGGSGLSRVGARCTQAPSAPTHVSQMTLCAGHLAKLRDTQLGDRMNRGRLASVWSIGFRVRL